MRGRKAKLDRPVEWKVSIPTSVADAINELLRDPFLDKPALGARSELTTQLYREYLAKQGIQLKEIDNA